MRSTRGIIAVATLLSAACTGVGPLSPTVGQLGVTVDSPVLTSVGSQTRVHLVLPDGSSTDLTSVVWRSNAPGVASVDGNGMVSAVSHGAATITAEAMGLSASTTITVDVNVVTTATVRSSATDPAPGNDTAAVTVTVQAD